MPVLNVRLPHQTGGSAAGAKSTPVMVRHPDHLRAVARNATSGSTAEAAARALSGAHPILGTLTEQAGRALLRWSRLRSVKRREMICHQGDPAGTIILVMEGYLKRSTLLASGDEAVLGVIGPGDSDGELSALLELPYETNLTALSRGVLLIIDARQFRQAFDREPEGLLAVMRLAAGRLRMTTEQVLDSRALPTPVRLAKVLLYLAKLPTSEPCTASCLPVRLSQTELGAMVGVCREVVNKLLGAWRDAGWISMSGGIVTSVDAVAIADLVQDEVHVGADVAPRS
jgi:CRP-like cAMP-binding protein